jgi:hypothetical protein
MVQAKISTEKAQMLIAHWELIFFYALRNTAKNADIARSLI